MIYIAKRDCYYGNALFKTGEKIDYTREVVPCPACGGKIIEGTKKLCLKCRGTGRIDPPHHFRLASESVEVSKQNDEKADVKEIEQLRQEIKDMDGSYDNRWGITRLRQTKITLRKEKGGR